MLSRRGAGLRRRPGVCGRRGRRGRCAPLALSALCLALWRAISAIPATAAAVASPAAAFGALTLVRRLGRRAGLLPRDRRQVGIDSAGLAWRSLLPALSVALCLAAAVTLTFTPLAALAVARLIALATRLLLRCLRRTRASAARAGRRAAPPSARRLAHPCGRGGRHDRPRSRRPRPSPPRGASLRSGAADGRGLGRLAPEPSDDRRQPTLLSRGFRHPFDGQRRRLRGRDALDDGLGTRRFARLFLLRLDEILLFRTLHHVERCRQRLALVQIVVAQARAPCSWASRDRCWGRAGR